MATVIFRLYSGDVATQDNPHTSKAALKERIERAMKGPYSVITLVPQAGGPVIQIEKSDIKAISYED